MSKQTPSPWTVIAGKGQYAFEVSGKTPRGKDLVVARVGGGPLARESNAHLIAAAPELLAALRLCAGQIDNWFRSMDEQEITDSFGGMNEALISARAAIAKATGEQT